MSSVDFITFCCPKDIVRLSQPGELTNRVNSHGYPFTNVHVIRQRCRGKFDDIIISSSDFSVTEWATEDFPYILQEYGLPDVDPKAEAMTHGPSAAHYWKNHVVNHLIGTKVSRSDFIVFSDCDCRIISQPPQMTWIDAGIRLLTQYSKIFMVSPGDGGDMAEDWIPGGARLTQNVSQQLFLVRRTDLLNANLNIPWDWEFLAPGAPMQEYYYMLEGRIWRYLNSTHKFRAILPDTWRYWHDQW